MTVYLDNQAIELTGDASGLLYWPKDWEDELRSAGFIQVATTILTNLPQAAVATPWLISSAKRTLLGSPRSESESHLSGRAFDMAPMYSAKDLLSPDGQIMGLAWNVMSLALLSWAFSAYPHFVVEGDHLHVQPNAELPEDIMFAAFTMPTWYEFTKTICSDGDVSELVNSIWSFDQASASLRLATRDELEVLRKALLR